MCCSPVPPKTRRERAEDVRAGGLPAAGELRDLLLGIQRAYEIYGEDELATGKLQSFVTGRCGSVSESRERLGELPAARYAFRRMQASLYAN